MDRNDALEYVVRSVASTGLLVFLTRLPALAWGDFIPPTNQILSWGMGLMVGASMTILNLYKLYSERQKNKKRDNDE